MSVERVELPQRVSQAVTIDHLSVERRRLLLGIDISRPRFAWRLEGMGDGARQTAYQLQVLDTGDPRASWVAPTWDTGRCAAGASTYVPYTGPTLQSRHRYSWRARIWDGAGAPTDWSAPAEFEMGLLSANDWSARWIAPMRSDLASEPEELRAPRPVALLRRRFDLPTAPERARLYITALGLYDAFVNGQRVGDEWLTPGWTDYNTRVQYQTYDVTDLLREGANVLGVRLGDGWYTGNVGGLGRVRYGDEPALMCQLEVQLPSGQQVVVGTDEGWLARESGTWLNDLQTGERTDFRREPAGWNAADADETDWQPVALHAGLGSRLVAARDDGVRVVDVLPALSIREAGQNRYVVDLGANAAGVLRVRARGQPGQPIVMRHAEALDDQGELYTVNLRTAEQRDEFILASESDATFEPRFTFHGFRYAEISGAGGPLAADEVTYQVLSSATRQVGSFSCSDPLVDKLQSNIVTSLRANFISIPTDCPQRNERLGWTADLQIFAPTALFNADVTNLLDKWLDDLVDAQLVSGAYPDVAPQPPGFVGWGNTAWGDAGVIVPWVMYERSGDAGVMERMYDSMRRFMAYLEADQTNGYRFAGRYGDWVSLGARSDKTFIGTAYLAYVADLFARIAAVVGGSRGSEGEERFRAFADRVRGALQHRFLGDDGRLTAETQTTYAMALAFNLLPEELRASAGDRLAELVEAADTHLATGFLGTPLVMPALSDNGQHELACRLLRQTTYPSWLFEVRNGATSIWERWNGWTPEQGFHPSRMNSFNHYAFGAVGDWMYRYLAGLDPVEPGYRRTRLRPRPGGGFTSAQATHESLYGVHACGWQLQNGSLRVDVQVPANTSATVVLPVPGADGVRMNGHPPQSSRLADGSLEIDVSPGRHSFEVPYRA
jgi:alpha-L-rhamnosidase